MANSLYPADFMYDNMIMEMNMIKNAYDNGVKKLLSLEAHVYIQEWHHSL